MRRGLVVVDVLLKGERSLLMLHSTCCSAISSPAIANRTSSCAKTSMATTVQAHKKALRSDIRKALKALSPQQRAHEDFAIQSTILGSSWFKWSQRLCAYISCPALREVDTSTILSQLLTNSDSEHQVQTQKELYVPRVEDKNSNMRMLKITTMDDLVANSMNILEPSPLDGSGNQREDVMSATNPVDLFLLPGVCFDKEGRRLGRGGGYYDVLLKRYQDLALEKKWNKPLLVALAYSVQIKDEGVIPVTPTDVPIDAIVSSGGVIPISPIAKEKMS
ncbi:5-formyltetrahydrofolate cyclo-ligase [Rhynchospora pubera]|uniref:5-formyltetrahydrofolate cyclo-ligase n=1 Tax=Rhynchospora pubera TaxID=906938 RepID=A0AAV8FGG3_9POAL|nr:5-formyltetrahydrofolate cyclo-ligase [Rhynchospora pubera]